MTEETLGVPEWFEDSERRVAHAWRRDHTLCGITGPETRYPDRADPPARRCSECSSVPPGYAMHLDMQDAGLSYRQVNYWTSQGWLVADERPPGVGSGHRMMWPGEEWRIAVIAALLITEAGFTAEGACRAARAGGRLAEGIRVVIEREDGPAL